MKLGQLEGIPNKRDNGSKIHHISTFQEGFNACKSEYDSLDLRMDVEELAHELYREFRSPVGHSHIEWDKLHLHQRNYWMNKSKNLIKGISDNVAKIVRVGK